MQSWKRDSKQLTHTGTWGNKIKGPFWTVRSPQIYCCDDVLLVYNASTSLRKNFK
jgi:hypothetical protein